MTTTPRTVRILDAPSNLGLKQLHPEREPGVFRMAEVLHQTGLTMKLGAKYEGCVPRFAYTGEFDLELGVRHARLIHAYSIALAHAIETILQRGEFPLVLGGDCSILLGAAIGLKRRGRCGLLFIDGHADFLHPSTSQTGGAAGMDLALATGYGPEVLTNIEGRKPYFAEQDVVLIGNRDIEDKETYSGRLLFLTDIVRYSLEQFRQSGIHTVMHDALESFNALDGFWIHLDVDVLDSELMPAVDSPQQGGLTYEELGEILRIALASPKAWGLQMTIFDPDYDLDGRLARELTELLVLWLPELNSFIARFAAICSVRARRVDGCVRRATTAAMCIM